jgi:hypothetical protein
MTTQNTSGPAGTGPDEHHATTGSAQSVPRCSCGAYGEHVLNRAERRAMARKGFVVERGYVGQIHRDGCQVKPGDMNRLGFRVGFRPDGERC